MPWLGLVPVGISVDIYKMVGKLLYLYVGRGRDGRGKVGQTNNNRGKDLVPKQKLDMVGREPYYGMQLSMLIRKV